MCSAAAVGILAAMPAQADGPCIPRYGGWQDLVFLPEAKGDIEILEPGDFDGDGWTDVLVARIIWQTPEALEISILLNDPEQGLRDATLELFEGPVTKAINPKAVLLEDFNGDGRLDAFIADHGMDKEPMPGAQNTLVLSTPEGKLRDATDQLPQQSDYTHSASAGDIDGDGDIDIFLGNMFEATTRAALPYDSPHFLINDGQGNFVADFGRIPRQRIDAEVNWIPTVFLFDANADGYSDLILGQGPESSYIFLNDERGFFGRQEMRLPPSHFSPRELALGYATGDLDGDGNLDLLAHFCNLDFNGRALQLLLSNGDGTFSDQTDARLDQETQVIGGQTWLLWAKFLDLNHDGSLDIVGDPLTGQEAFYLNDGNGRFVQWNPPMDIGNLAVLDVNRDGKLDILSSWQPSQTPEGWREAHTYYRYLGCD